MKEELPVVKGKVYQVGELKVLKNDFKKQMNSPALIFDGWGLYDFCSESDFAYELIGKNS